MHLFARTLAAALMTASAAATPTAAQVQTPALQLEAKIPLGRVNGRIDHMAVDLVRQRLFVAELGNNTVSVVDLTGHRVVHRLEGMKEPQGIAYVPQIDTLFVANGGDGTLRMFRGSDYVPAGQIDLGGDADNVRLDTNANQLVVGYGEGALAIIDLVTTKKVASIALSAHPEGFQLEPDTSRVFVNLPRARTIGVIDRRAARLINSWPMITASGNYPMALTDDHVVVAFRNPAKLGVFAKGDGAPIASPDICGDADDVFVDAKRQQVYVSCGAGFLDVLDIKGGAYRRVARIPTAVGARTSIFVPELDRLLLAVRAAPGETAAIWIYKPAT